MLDPQHSSQTVQTSCHCCKQKGDKGKDIKSEARLSCSNEQVLNHKGSIQQHAHDNRKAIKLAPPSTVSRQSELSSCRMQKQQHQQHKLDSEIRHTQCKKDFKKSMLLGQNNTRELLPQKKEDEHDHITNCNDRSTQTSSFQCSQCEICFPRKSELQHHKKSQHRVSSGRAVRCVRCCLTFRDKSKLENHRNSQSCRKSVPSNYCVKCGLTCKDDDMLQQHMRGKHKKKAQLMCSRCKKTFREAEALERHQRDKHGFHIPDDGMRIPGNISLKAKGLSLCQVCGRLFTHEDDLEQHCRDKHANVDVTNASVLSPCQVCWRIFTQVDDLDEHYRDRHEKEDVKKTSSNAGLIDSAIPETITHAHSMNWGSLLKQKADNLTTYMEMHLQPTDECNDGISSIITEMLTYLQGYTKICRYIKAGCLGQGIHLLNSVDVKLLLFLEDFNSLEDMRHNLWTKFKASKSTC
ncbi:GDNF-inducible zinc finger protein 1-like isoform X2 [Ptychodera flava]|uniref:GDNF-inducible zinc finger protein 1-like isoform X2 n=1 Tax=Ptychodera flava TaxID=63121 RepID=UPI00396A7F60